MAIDIFANNGSATVSSGGTTAPAAGTSETWTLASIVGLAASTGVTQMRLICGTVSGSTFTQDSNEIVLLTNLSGTTATVTRGAEGTTPFAHSAGFTVKAVASAASLNAAMLSVASTYAATPVVPQTGRYYLTYHTAGNPATVSAGNNVISYSPFLLLQAATVTSLSVYVKTASATGGANARIGLYKSDGTALQPGTLVTDAGTVAVDSTGAKSIAVSIALNPGLYWCALGLPSTYGGWVGTRGGGTAPAGGVFGSTSIDAAQTPYGYYSPNFAIGQALPASASSLSVSDNNPGVFVGF